MHLVCTLLIKIIDELLQERREKRMPGNVPCFNLVQLSNVSH